MCATPDLPRPPSPLLCHLPACTLTLSRCAPIFYVAARAPPPPRPPRCTPPRSLLPFSAAVPRRVGVGVVGRRRVVTRDDRVHAGAAGLLPPFTAASRCAPLAACAELSPSCRMVISFFPTLPLPVLCTVLTYRAECRTVPVGPPPLGSHHAPVSAAAFLPCRPAAASLPLLRRRVPHHEPPRVSFFYDRSGVMALLPRCATLAARRRSAPFCRVTLPLSLSVGSSALSRAPGRRQFGAQSPHLTNQTHRT